MLIKLENGHVVVEGRYWNANGFAVAIVAVINPEVDWAAYIGASPDFGPVKVEGCAGAFDQECPWGHWSEEDTCRWVARHGCKLSKETASFFFRECTVGDKKLEEMEYRL